MTKKKKLLAVEQIKVVTFSFWKVEEAWERFHV